MNSLSLPSMSCYLTGSFLKSSVVSMINTFSVGQVLNHFSCFSWIIFRQSKGISLSSALCRFLVRSQHFSGEHRRQMTLVLSIWVMDSKLEQRDLKTSYSLSSMQPKSFISSEKTYLSARMLRSEILIFQGKRWMASWSFWMRVKMAQIWKVKPHRLGSLQYFSSMLMFLPLRFCHSETGSSIHFASGTRCLRIQRKVDFPQPMLPSIVQQKSFLGDSGFMAGSAVIQLQFPANILIFIIQMAANQTNTTPPHSHFSNCLPHSHCPQLQPPHISSCPQISAIPPSPQQITAWRGHIFNCAEHIDRGR